MKLGPGEIEVEIAVEHSDLTRNVIDLSRKHQRNLGQLPYAAFHEAARQGTLIVAANGTDIAGYVLFRVTKRTGAVVLTHLCVAEEHVGNGIAHLLIAAAVERYPHAPGIGLKCRKDYDAHDVWPKLGFEARGQSQARAKNRVLVHWWRPINDHTLFTFDPDIEDRPAAAIDANVFRDLHEPRPKFASSVALHDDWLTGVVELVTTAQLGTEIVDASEELPHLRGALDWYQRLSPSPSEVASELARLTPSLMSPDIKDKDRRHIAMAAMGGARYFVTRDADVLSHATTIDRLTGLRVLSPSDLVLELHAEQFESSYRPEAILATAAEITPLSHIPDRSEFARFADPQNRERARDLEGVFRSTAALASAGGKLWALRATGEELAGVMAFVVANNAMTVRAIRVASRVHRPTFCRQLIHVLRQEAVAQGCETIEFNGTLPHYVRDALASEGLRSSDDGYSAPCPRGVFDWNSDLIDRVRAEEAPTAADARIVSEAERRFWPARFNTGRVPAYIVPIQPQWARPLFDNDPPQGELFDRPLRLGLAREHVYYRSYRSKLEFPARILWYVSGTGPNAGFCGTSWLDFAVSDRPASLFQRFGPQGIYLEDNVRSCVQRSGGKATALVFSRTEMFPRRISLQRGRQLHPPLKKNGALQSMSTIDEHVFYAFQNEGLS